RPYVDQHVKRLNQLWNNDNIQFSVFSIPEAIKRKFVQLRSSENRPYRVDRPPVPPPKGTTITQGDVNLYEYQQNALTSWVDSGCRGILEMATGTGKTLTALSCAFNRHQTLGRLALIILVPYLHLLEQWEANCRTFGFQPILCSGHNAEWQTKVKSKIQDFNIGAI